MQEGRQGEPPDLSAIIDLQLGKEPLGQHADVDDLIEMDDRSHGFDFGTEHGGGIVGHDKNAYLGIGCFHLGQEFERIHFSHVQAGQQNVDLFTAQDIESRLETAGR